VSQQVQALEAEVKAPMFDRSTRPPTLTTQGHQLLEAARDLVRTAEEAVDAISGRRVIGTLTIGTVRTSALGVLPQAIVALKASFPELRVKLRISNSDELLSDVAAGRLDVAVVAEHLGIPSGLRWTPFIREPLLVIAPAGTPRRPAEQLIAELPYIRFRSTFRLAQLIDNELARMGVVPSEIAEIDTIAAIVPCVVHGLGVSVVPNIALQGLGTRLTAVPFGDPTVFRQMGIAARRKHPRAVVIDALHGKLAALSGRYGVAGAFPGAGVR
jgi:DNA-binding transcriptional LysR family regulator